MAAISMPSGLVIRRIASGLVVRRTASVTTWVLIDRP